MQIRTIYMLSLLLFFLFACEEGEERADAYGNFEATTVLISAQASGQLLYFSITEGQRLEAGQEVGLVDTTLLDLQRQQLRATLGTLPKKLQHTLAEIEVYQKQRANLQRERERVARLLTKQAATPKQLDDLDGELAVVDQRIAAIRANTQTANRAILSEQEPLLAQIRVLDEQIRRAYCHNPIRGTVLTKLAEEGERVGPGSPLYRIGQLDTMTLRAYASATQLQEVTLGQGVEVWVDAGTEAYETLNGTISYIADQAEFTPKTIQTKEDRVNLVYALEVRVANPNGRLKIGMPGEVRF
jgi:HlyD family secretion protein